MNEPYLTSRSHATIEIRPVGQESAPIIQKIFENCPDYFLKVEGSDDFENLAQREMKEVPKKRALTYQKLYCIIFLDNKPIGVLDLHKNHPKENKGYIGLLLLESHYQGKGLGKLCYQASEEFIRNLGMDEIYIAIHESNDVTPFWEKMGYKPNGHVSIWKGVKISGKITEFTKKI